MADKLDTRTSQIDLAQSMDDDNTIELTKEGLEKHRSELKHLIDDVRPEVQEQLKEARAQGDLSENADYDAAKEKQGEVEARIIELEDIISRVKVIDTTNNNKNIVELGEFITFVNNKTKNELKVQVVGTIESDPTAEIPRVSSKSPLGVALLGAKLGDKVKVEAPKSYYAEIKKISKKA